MARMLRGLFVGRFQPPHRGHIQVLKRLLEGEVDELVIVIGSAQFSHEPQNPFTTGERVTMLTTALREAGVDLTRCYVVPVPDTKGEHALWVAQVITYCPKFSAVFTNEPLTQRLFKEVGFDVRSVPFYNRELYSSTEVRKRLLRGENWEELVPSSVAEFIKEIDGAGRMASAVASHPAPEWSP